MSRKDYQRLASILKRYRDYCMMTSLVAEIADWLQDDNPRFDRERFRKAVFGGEPCGD